jgi:plastocyanin
MSSWVNRDFVRHTATARDKTFDLSLEPRTSGRTVVRKAGTITFYCRFHPGMKGGLGRGEMTVAS